MLVAVVVMITSVESVTAETEILLLCAVVERDGTRRWSLENDCDAEEGGDENILDQLSNTASTATSVSMMSTSFSSYEKESI